eukprot:1748-Rhodomonas_salina.1
MVTWHQPQQRSTRARRAAARRGAGLGDARAARAGSGAGKPERKRNSEAAENATGVAVMVVMCEKLNASSVRCSEPLAVAH